MCLSLEDFAAECRDTLKAKPGTAGRQLVCALVRQVLKDPDFVATYVPADTPERKVLYEDPELGFAILAHAYHGPRNTRPHDHGPAWAIYGQVDGETIMTDWELVAAPTETAPGKVCRLRDYTLTAGMAMLYEPGALHSPLREGPTRLLRIEGINLDRVKRQPYEEVDLSPAD
jgi:hypothetical protein